MDLKDIVFLGCNRDFASVKVRCIDIAKHLGCDYILGQPYAHEIPDKYRAFVCVKPYYLPEEFNKLSRRGVVIWDIIDDPPPQEGVNIYLASTSIVKELFSRYGCTMVIPHYHCNIGGKPNSPHLRRPGWIGSQHWLPSLKGFTFDIYNVKGMSRRDVVQAHRKIGIGLNFRNEKSTICYNSRDQRLMRDFHVAINSGIKLINCIGFGIPSVSNKEPAYHEIGADCTIFSSLNRCSRWVRDLQNDDDLYNNLRQNCLKKSKKYNLETIIEKYLKLFASL